MKCDQDSNAIQQCNTAFTILIPEFLKRKEDEGVVEAFFMY